MEQWNRKWNETIVRNSWHRSIQLSNLLGVLFHHRSGMSRSSVARYHDVTVGSPESGPMNQSAATRQVMSIIYSYSSWGHT